MCEQMPERQVLGKNKTQGADLEEKQDGRIADVSASYVDIGVGTD